MASSKQLCHLGLRSEKTLQAEVSMEGIRLFARLVPSLRFSLACAARAIGPGSLGQGLGLGLGLKLLVTH